MIVKYAMCVVRESGMARQLAAAHGGEHVLAEDHQPPSEIILIIIAIIITIIPTIIYTILLLIMIIIIIIL